MFLKKCSLPTLSTSVATKPEVHILHSKKKKKMVLILKDNSPFFFFSCLKKHTSVNGHYALLKDTFQQSFIGAEGKKTYKAQYKWSQESYKIRRKN